MRVPLFVCCLVLVVPAVGKAQESFTVEGRVVDATLGTGIISAAVRIEGHGGVLSGPTGDFSFTGVRRGTYTLTAEAFGYLEMRMTVTVAGDETVTVLLSPAPIALDSLRVEATTIDFDGRVRDARFERTVQDAEIVTNQGHREQTKWHGRFDLDDVYEDVPMRVVIRAFGYEPLDTTFVPDPDGRHDFYLRTDSVAIRMIAEQAARLDRRMAGEDEVFRPFRTRPVLNRTDIMESVTGSGTLQTLLESKYSLAILRNVGCLVIDEQRVNGGMERAHVLRSVLPQEVERVELIEFPDQQHVVMMRVYTRAFMQDLVATRPELRTPIFVRFTRTCR